MSVTELRKNIKKLVDDPANKNILDKVYFALTNNRSRSAEGVYIFSQGEKKALEEALADVKAGRVHSHDEVEKDLSK